jgi:2-keto-4-pentenoate hydratase/2-oxohepta-3-ene-1,7-dioic acid hydratase in catechol pathway
VITLGTPPPPPPVAPGDVLEIEVEGIGVLTNRIV